MINSFLITIIIIILLITIMFFMPYFTIVLAISCAILIAVRNALVFKARGRILFAISQYGRKHMNKKDFWEIKQMYSKYNKLSYDYMFWHIWIPVDTLERKIMKDIFCKKQ